MQSLTLISIVVVTYNRADILRRALESLSLLQSHSDFDLEVVVVDNASSDHTQEVIKECALNCRFSMRSVVEPKPGIPFARNRGVESAKGSWIAFFDDDQLAATDWLIQLFETAKKLNVLCVGGARDLLIETIPTPKLNAYSRQLLGENVTPHEQYYHYRFVPNTGNVLVAKEVFEKVGRFDERALDGSEDADFFYRMIRTTPSYYQPKALVTHLISSNRLTPEYLGWIAFRHGLFYGRRDFQDNGRPMTFLLAIARWARALVTNVPSLVIAKLSNRPWDAIGMRCKLILVYGYTTFLFNDPRASAKLSEKTMHRGKG